MKTRTPKLYQTQPQKIIQEGSKQHTIAGKTYGKTPTHNRILVNMEKYFHMLRATIL